MWKARSVVSGDLPHCQIPEPNRQPIANEQLYHLQYINRNFDGGNYLDLIDIDNKAPGLCFHPGLHHACLRYEDLTSHGILHENRVFYKGSADRVSITLPWTPAFINFKNRLFLLTKSKALEKSTIHRYSGFPRINCLWTNPCRMNRLSLVLLPLVNPPLYLSPVLYAAETKLILLFTAVSNILVNTEHGDHSIIICIFNKTWFEDRTAKSFYP